MYRIVRMQEKRYSMANSINSWLPALDNNCRGKIVYTIHWPLEWFIVNRAFGTRNSACTASLKSYLHPNVNKTGYITFCKIIIVTNVITVEHISTHNLLTWQLV